MRAMKTVKSSVRRSLCQRKGLIFSDFAAGRQASKWAKSGRQALMGRPCRNLQLTLDFPAKRISIEVSPPIQFRIEWADSQGMSPLLGCRPILIFQIKLLLRIRVSKDPRQDSPRFAPLTTGPYQHKQILAPRFQKWNVAADILQVAWHRTP